MRLLKIATVLVVTAGLAVLPACGGGKNQGFRAGTGDPLVLVSNVLPALLSGQTVDYEFPTTGGCGGPYELNLVAGSLPKGVDLDDREANIDGPGVPATNQKRLVGNILEDGNFAFTVEIIDRGCNPFRTLVAQFIWDVQKGPLVIVDADPPLVDPNSLPSDITVFFSDVPSLEPVVFNQPITYNFIIAGGTGPYNCTLINDPNDPDDDLGLPLGMNFIPSSCSIFGAPGQVGPGGAPFRLTVRVEDQLGAVIVDKFQLPVRTPPLLIANANLPDGKAGTPYNDFIQTADGVPPFNFEWTGVLPVPNDNTDPTWIWAPPAAPVIPGGVAVSATTGRDTSARTQADYPNPPNTVGPYTNIPPEGVFMTRTGGTAGVIEGVPRRVGQFNNVVVHAYSALVFNFRGQHAYAEFNFGIADSEPPLGLDPAYAIDPNFTLEQVLSTGIGDGAPNCPELNVTAFYNPDSLSHPPQGLLLLGEGGVPQDNLGDHPHRDEVQADFGAIAAEAANESNYTWSVTDWDVDKGGIQGPPPEVAIENDSVLNTTDKDMLVRQPRQVFNAEMTDEQLPTPHVVDNDFGIAVGPDRVIITQSPVSMTTNSNIGATDWGQHDDHMFIQQFNLIAGSSGIIPLDDTVLTAQGMPGDASLAGTNLLGQLLSGLDNLGMAVPTPGGNPVPRHPGAVDLMRIVVNPSGWWDDAHGLNPKAGRHGQGGDFGGDRAYWSQQYLNPSSSGSLSGGGPGYQPSATSVDLPDVPSVISDLPNDIYTDGGDLFAFETSTHIGFFVIRSSAKIYVPFAIQKGAFQAFGDGHLRGLAANRDDRTNSVWRTVQICVSPNGRFAACKIKPTLTNNSDRANATSTVIFSLTGEAVFPGPSTYRILPSDGGLGGNVGNGYHYAASMVMTNDHLYYLIGANLSTTLASWRDHWIIRSPIIGGGPALANGFSSGACVWQNANGAPSSNAMQTPFQKYDNNIVSSASTFTFVPTFMQVNIDFPYIDKYMYDGANLLENSIAQLPFRVSYDGTSCGLIAGPSTASSSGSSLWQRCAWVDTSAGGFRPASLSLHNKAGGAARAHVLRRGANRYRHWGMYEGPSGQFEIADDGDAVAFTVTTGSAASHSATATIPAFNNDRQEIIACDTTNDWTTVANEHNVTNLTFGGSTSGASVRSRSRATTTWSSGAARASAGPTRATATRSTRTVSMASGPAVSAGRSTTSTSPTRRRCGRSSARRMVEPGSTPTPACRRSTRARRPRSRGQWRTPTRLPVSSTRWAASCRAAASSSTS